MNAYKHTNTGCASHHPGCRNGASLKAQDLDAQAQIRHALLPIASSRETARVIVSLPDNKQSVSRALLLPFPFTLSLRNPDPCLFPLAVLHPHGIPISPRRFSSDGGVQHIPGSTCTWTCLLPAPHGGPRTRNTAGVTIISSQDVNLVRGGGGTGLEGAREGRRGWQRDGIAEETKEERGEGKQQQQHQEVGTAAAQWS
jgi:hypothetical protein